MRTAMKIRAASEKPMQTAWPSSIPSASVLLTSLLRRRGSASARCKRSALQSLQLSPPSVERITPKTSKMAKSHRDGEGATRTASRGRKTTSSRGGQLRIGHALPARATICCDRSKPASRCGIRFGSASSCRNDQTCTPRSGNWRGGNFGRDQCFHRRHPWCRRRRDLDRAGAGRR